MIDIYYVPGAMATFSFIALLLQLPLLIAYARGPEPNIPVVTLASWFTYKSLSTFITAISWTSEDLSNYWLGTGWCDIDIHVNAAANTGILLAQFAINIHLLEVFKYRPKHKTEKEIIVRSIIDSVICLLIPLVIIITFTFLTELRYEVIQYLGCTTYQSPSVALFVLAVLPLPILSVLSCAMTLAVLLRTFLRGRRATFETVSYLPRMNPGYFVRMTIFSLIITVVVVPMSLYLFVTDITTLFSDGFVAIPWAHGKPQGWDTVYFSTAASFQERSPGIATNFVVMIILLAVAYLFFLCYGTGSIAMQFYKDTARLLKIDHLFFKAEVDESDDGVVDWDEIVEMNQRMDHTGRSSRFPTSPTKKEAHVVDNEISSDSYSQDSMFDSSPKWMSQGVPFNRETLTHPFRGASQDA